MKPFDNNEFEGQKAEAKNTWGQTAAYQEYEGKTKDYSREKFSALAEKTDQIMAQFAMCMKSGASYDSAPAQTLVQALQEHISKNYYHCTSEILAGLGQMYVADERFKHNIDKHAPGTAVFLRSAISHYCSSVPDSVG